MFPKYWVFARKHVVFICRANLEYVGFQNIGCLQGSMWYLYVGPMLNMYVSKILGVCKEACGMYV